MIKKFSTGLILSIIVFFSISFLTVLISILTPVNQTIGFKILKIGFPFTYYEQTLIVNELNHSWNMNKLILNCILTWILVNGIYFWRIKIKTNANNV
ncbi:hypothetical protein GCM10008088_27860 [Mesonia mobilis]|uniref:Uncharacterized protein n=1 Tax=Mesonia mobilis TaxID=369791 RepID=A0ABQ3C1N3_9FLAO|nr:hypothetical protein GCM10008088_27860 [Mesonia mobilis]